MKIAFLSASMIHQKFAIETTSLIWLHSFFLAADIGQCYVFGCDRLFALLASQAALQYRVSNKFRHMDSTSMTVHGEYDSDDPSPPCGVQERVLNMNRIRYQVLSVLGCRFEKIYSTA